MVKLRNLYGEKQRFLCKDFVKCVKKMSDLGYSFKNHLKKSEGVVTIILGRNWFYFFTKYKMEG